MGLDVELLQFDLERQYKVDQGVGEFVGLVGEVSSLDGNQQLVWSQHGQLPLKSGLRFSLNAATPSIRSRVGTKQL